MKLDDYVGLARVSAVAASPDGTWLAVSVQRLDSTGAKFASDLWRVPVASGSPTQLTRGDTRDGSPAFRHDGALAFLSNRKPVDGAGDADADKRMQVWVLPAEGGEPVQLTDEPLGVESFAFAQHADRFVYFAPVLPGVEHAKQRETASERAKTSTSARRYVRQPTRHWDHWLHDSATGARSHLISVVEGRRHDLTPNADFEFAIEPHLDISPDGKRAVATWSSIGPDRIDDTALAIFDLDARTLARHVSAGPRTGLESPKFSPDSQAIAALKTQRIDGRLPVVHLALVAAASGATTDLAAHWDTWPHLFGWSHDGAKVLAGADERGRSKVFSVDAKSGQIEPVIDSGSNASIVALDATRIAGVHSSLIGPPEAFVAELKAKAPIDLKSSFASREGLPDVVVEEFDTPSSDGKPIHAWLIKPSNATGKLPVVMFIHGGPISAFGDLWHWRWNPLLLAARGYAVVMPNPRGSTGYGRDFIEGVWGNQWGAQCYEDLMAVADAVAARPDIDSRRFAAMGGSFGGYMSNWIGTQTDRFQCLITHASIYWMHGFTGTTDHSAFWHYQMNAQPDTPASVFDRYSPSAYVANWKTPVLIIHGEKDYRCPISESLMLFEALQQRGVSSEMVIFPDENHWILKPKNVVAWIEAVIEFLDRHLKQ